MNEEQIDYLRKNAYGRSRRELVELFKEKFGVTFSFAQIKYYKNKYDIKSGVISHPARLLSEQQIEWLKSFLPVSDYSILLTLLKQKYGISLTRRQIINLFSKKGIKSGVLTGARKGQTYNTGKKLSKEHREKISHVMFQKGRESHNKKPVGTEHVCRNGYIIVKVAEPNTWRAKHHVEWEKHHEPIKKSEVIIFLDGDRTNCRIENLMVITKAENHVLNHKHMRSKDADTTKASALVARLQILRNERLKAKKGFLK
ncbi:MAG: HNH endonuclease [Prevotella sp.]|nr:HNH endonuclease [Prevotella sp.]